MTQEIQIPLVQYIHIYIYIYIYYIIYYIIYIFELTTTQFQPDALTD